jgi:hypothetical protein
VPVGESKNFVLVVADWDNTVETPGSPSCANNALFTVPLLAAGLMGLTGRTLDPFSPAGWGPVGRQPLWLQAVEVLVSGAAQGRATKPEPPRTGE